MKDKNINWNNLEKDVSGQFLPDLLIQEVLDDLEMEEAVLWLLDRLNADRGVSDPKHVYSTSLFSMTVDFADETVIVSAELGCHPQDEVVNLRDFMDVLSSRMATPVRRGNSRNTQRARNHEFRHDVLLS